jgi:hypothetical protein
MDLIYSVLFHEDLWAFVNEAANSLFVLLQIIIRNRFQASADASCLLILLLQLVNLWDLLIVIPDRW